MALNTARNWLITYDITDPRRLARLHRFLSKIATPVQYSVFHYRGSAARMGKLIEEIKAQINGKSDDVRAYQLPENMNIDTLGLSRIPDDALLLSAPDSLNALLHVGGSSFGADSQDGKLIHLQ